MKMSVSLSSEDQLVADLGERRNATFRRDLVQARAEYFARGPAMTPGAAAALQAFDNGERAYRDLHEQ